ncbi:glycerol-3-phosphate 1-O-acyltransferase PlsY [Burkholderiaceae bacterium FT117]|uniref:glycerol-3-phosphate 1-O-acyltransferase PlsY n=1 Tax=Zeimonas sediminis TaxID=2944268 RepID=UPI002342FB2F|nr:glycerol-3-phosphate 1-O-acyltransferase PlsY [Zeimonas sediminis]MCM5570517.1 glycerol-3-phosphate 1-O-acyltransferase PlsY [Zeimonas sediminis]
MDALYSVLAVAAAYLIGSVSFAVVVSKVMGLADPRSYGSKNPGATNVLRTGNRKAALFTLLGDALKGVVAVLLAKGLAGPLGFGDGTIALVALAVFVGHLFPVFHGFKGGKGVATAAGVLLALHPLLGVGTLLTWVIIAWFFRYSSLAALVSAIFAPLWYLFLFRPDPIAAAVTLMSLLLIWRHASNIQNLMAGKESRIGEKKGKGEGGSTGKGEAGRGKGRAGKR